jgi:hypothetical protein
MSFFKAGRHSSTEERIECPHCGAMGISRQRCPNPQCGRELAPSLGQVFLDPFLDVGTTAKKSFRKKAISSDGATSSRGGGAGVLIVLAMLGGGVIWYIAKFTGDFEARRDGVVAHVEPAADSATCGDAMDDGDNLTCVHGSDGCETTDELDGRWVKVERKDNKCWVSYADVTFQHGMFMSLVGKVFHLKTTDEVNAAAIASYADALSKKAPQLRAQGNWPELARIAGRTRGKNLPLSSEAKEAIDEGADRVHYADLLERAKKNVEGDPADALQALTEAGALKYPSDKPEIGPLRKQAEEALFTREIAALQKDSKADPASIVDRLVRLASLGAPSDKSAVTAPLAAVAKRLRAQAKSKPDDVIASVDKARGSAPLLDAAGSARDVISADLGGAWEAAWGAKMTALLTKAGPLVYSKPKDAYALVCQVRDAPGPSDKAAADRLAAQIDGVLSGQAQPRARAYLQAIADRKWAAVRDYELPFVKPDASTGDAWASEKEAWATANPSIDPKGKRIGKSTVTVKDCGAKVELTFELTGAPDVEARPVVVDMCPGDKGAWYPCALLTPAS